MADKSINEGSANGDEEIYTFGDFQLFTIQRILLEGENRVPLGGRAFTLLEALVREAGRIVTKEQLLSVAWPNVFVQEGSLRVQIAALRKHLREAVGGRRYIANDTGRGYRFVYPVIRSTRGVPKQRPWTQELLIGNLPAVVTRVFGRQSSIDAIEASLPHQKLITVVGSGGIGKTTLAISAAVRMQPHYVDGVWFVDLASISDAALVPSVLASIFEIAVVSADPTPELIAFMRDRQIVLLLDNCEHVLDSVATLVSAILAKAPHVRVLATSREPLRVNGEFVYHLGPLEAPPDEPELSVEAAMCFSAVQLFVDRSQSVLRDFSLSEDNVRKVGEICRRLDGIALAIELATARVNMFGVQGVAAQLDDRFRLLNKGHRAVTPRHRTLNAVFDWSYRLLPELSQRVYRRLSVFIGSFSLEAAIAIASEDVISHADVVNHLDHLISASLVVADITNERPTYRLLDSARAYGREKVIEHDEAHQLSQLHAHYFLSYFDRANSQYAHQPSQSWTLEHKPHLDNLRGAFDWATEAQEHEIRDALTVAAVPLLSHLSLTAECRQRVEIALAARPDGSPLDDFRRQKLLDVRGSSLLFARDGFADAAATLQQSLSFAEQVGDLKYQLSALRGQWLAFLMAGDIATAEQVESSCIELSGTPPSSEDAMILARMRGFTHFYRGKFKEALAQQRLSLELSLSGPRTWDIVKFQFDQRVLSYTNLAKNLWSLGFADQAKDAVKRGLEVARSIEHDFSLSCVIGYSACRIAIIRGDYAEADRYIDELSHLSAADPGLQWGLFAQCWRGTLLSRQGQALSGSSYLADALQHFPEGSFGLHHTRFLGELGYAQAQAGDVAAGLNSIERAISICDERDERWFYVELLRLKGEILLLDDEKSSRDLVIQTFEIAQKLAEHQEALGYQLRVATSLARLGIAEGSRRGIELLRATYDQFTEGFSTVDLVCARKLLDQLLP